MTTFDRKVIQIREKAKDIFTDGENSIFKLSERHKSDNILIHQLKTIDQVLDNIKEQVDEMHNGLWKK